MDSCVRGYHVYDEIWTAVLGEVLITERELHNVADRYAVAVKKHSGETVGHLPKKTFGCRRSSYFYIGAVAHSRVFEAQLF